MSSVPPHSWKPDRPCGPHVHEYRFLMERCRLSDQPPVPTVERRILHAAYVGFCQRLQIVSYGPHTFGRILKLYYNVLPGQSPDGAPLWRHIELLPPPPPSPPPAPPKDLLIEWVANCCVLGEAVTTTRKQVYLSYTEWCQRNGQSPLSKRQLAAALLGRFGVKQGPKMHGGIRTWKGIRIAGFTLLR